MDEEMLRDLGIVIHSSGGEVCKAIFSPTLSSSSENKSFRLPDDWEPPIHHEIKKLAKPSTWLREQMETSRKSQGGILGGGKRVGHCHRARYSLL
jgi:hypothetical protein